MDMRALLMLSCGQLAVVGLGVAASLAGPVDVATSRNETAEPMDRPELAQAIAAFRRRDLPATRRWLDQASQAYPDLAPTDVLLANMYFSDNQPAKGRELLELSAVKHPDDPEPHLIFGDLAWLERRMSDAHVQYERGGQLTAKFSGSAERKRSLKLRALAGLAKVAEARSDFQTAHRWLTALLTLDPEQANARFRMGNVLFALDRPDDALAEFRRSARLVESAPSAPLTLAQLYQQAGKSELAEHWIEQAINESPDDVRPVLAMARWQLEAHHALEAAAQHVDRAAALDPQSNEVPFLRGLIAWCRGELTRAEQEFESIVLKDPSHVTASNYLAAVLAEQDDSDRRERAWDLVQLTADVHPRHPETLATLGWVAYHRGDLDRAQQHLHAAAAAPGVGRDTTYYLARTQFRQGQMVAARQTLARALEAAGLFVHRDQARDWQREIGKPSNDE